MEELVPFESVLLSGLRFQGDGRWQPILAKSR